MPVFKGFKTLIWIHHKLLRESKIPFPTMFITSSLLTPNFKPRGVPGLPGYWKDVYSRRQTFIRDRYNAWPFPTWTFNSWRCAKGNDVKLQSSYPEEEVTQTHKEMTVFFPPSFPINTFTNLAERQVEFKIVHIFENGIISLLVINKELLLIMEF